MNLDDGARRLREAVGRAATILVASEPVPDGDAFGAELALRFMIERAFGLAARPEDARSGRGPKWVAILNERGVPGRYAFLDGASAARVPTAEDRGRSFDLGILVDGGVERCGPEVRAIFEKARARAYIDHHRQGSRAGYDVTLVDPARAATTELLALVLETEAWRDVALDRALAEALYVGIIADTGSFAYSLTTPRTHQVAARLLEAGTRATLLGEKVLLELPIEDVHLQAKVLSALSVERGGSVLLGVLPLEWLEGRDPLEVGYDRVITGISFVRASKVTVLLRELGDGEWKLSFRSRGEVDVAALARELDANGGGHARAAGCLLRGALAPVRARVLEAVGRALDRAGA